MENYIDEERLRKIIRETLLKEAKVVPHGPLTKSPGRAKFPNPLKAFGRIARLIFSDPVSILVFLVVLSYVEPEVYEDMIEFLTAPVKIFSGTNQALDDLDNSVAAARSASGPLAVPSATLDLITSIAAVPIAVISDVRGAKSTIRSKMSKTNPTTNTILGDVVKVIIQSLRSVGRTVLDESFILLIKENNSWKDSLKAALNPVAYIEEKLEAYKEKESTDSVKDALQLLRSPPGEYEVADPNDPTGGTTTRTGSPFKYDNNAKAAIGFPEKSFIDSSELNIDVRVGRLNNQEIIDAFRDEGNQQRLLNAGLSQGQIDGVMDKSSYLSLIKELGAQEKLYSTEF